MVQSQRIHFLTHAANKKIAIFKVKIAFFSCALYTSVCHSLAEPGFHILCCCHSFMLPLQLLTQFSFNIFSGKAPNSGCGGSCPTAFSCSIFSAKTMICTQLDEVCMNGFLIHVTSLLYARSAVAACQRLCVLCHPAP